MVVTGRGDTLNQPLEWTGYHQFFAAPPRTTCLPLRGSGRAEKAAYLAPCKKSSKVPIDYPNCLANHEGITITQRAGLWEFCCRV